jgi:hypothetical protein
MVLRGLTKPGGAGAAGALTNVNVSAGTTSNNLSNVVFSNANGVTFGLDGSTVTASVAAAAGATLNQYDPFGQLMHIVTHQGQGSLHLQPVEMPNIHHDRVVLRIAWSNASGSTGSVTISNWVALYSRNESTLSLVASASTSHAVTFSGTEGDWSIIGGIRLLSIPWTNTITAGNYWFGYLNRTTSGGTNASYNQLCVSQMGSVFSGLWSVATNQSHQRALGMGTYSATTAGIPGSIAFSQISGSGTLPMRPPTWFLLSVSA